MIQVDGLFKNFDDFAALKGVSLYVETGSIYGLIGVNGSGKTTLIKHIAGVFKADKGSVKLDGFDVYDNSHVKERVGYIPDDLFFFQGYNLKGMAKFYSRIYPNWSQDRFDALLADFNLPVNKSLSKFSKGMQKQAAFLLVISTKPDFLILDEPVDGLDPLVRHKLWKYVMADVADRQMTVLISSHNLRELEGVCDSIGILSAGQMKAERRHLDELEETIEQVFLNEMGGEDDEEIKAFLD